MVYKATFNNISVISWRSSFIGGGNWTPPTHPQVTNKLDMSRIRAHNVSGDRHRLHR